MIKLVGYLTNKIYIEAENKSSLIRLSNSRFNNGSYTTGIGRKKTSYIFPEPMIISEDSGENK